jgi:hypothetical protein
LDLKKISSVAVEGVTALPEGIVWSANGSLAILYSRSGNWFQTIAGLPGAPVAAAAVDITSLGGSFTAIAVDNAGQQIAVAISADSGGVYQASGGQLTRLVSMTKPQSLSFSSDGQTLYALDAATAEVLAVSVGGHGFQTLTLSGMANPIAIQSTGDSQNRQVLYVAGGTDRMLRILDVASRQIVADVPLNFQPTTLYPFSSSSFVLAVRSQSTNPLWLFAGAPQPAAYFVPAITLRRPEHRSPVIVGRTQ